MRQKIVSSKPAIKKIFTAGILAAAVSIPSYADHDHYGDSAEARFIDHNNRSFREAHPLRVHVAFKNRPKHKSRQHSDRTLAYTNQTIRKIAYSVPDNIILVDEPAYADMVIKVAQTDYDLNFRVIDVDRKDKKYKKNRYYGDRKCGPYKKAYYTRVKEKGEAYASYTIRVRMQGFEPDRDRITVRSAENFSYGKNLRASTRCGVQPTHVFPSKKVAKTFSRATPAYKHKVANEIRKEAASDLGTQLARQIVSRADHYYLNLAADLSRKPVYSGYGRNHEPYEYRQYSYNLRETHGR